MVKTHVVPLEKGINFRDLGGFVVKDGRRIKKGLLFRSGTLNYLTANDTDTLEVMGLASIIDFRDVNEAKDAPDVIPTTATYYNYPANPLHSQLSARFDKHNVALKGDSREFMLNLYKRLPFNNLAYKKLVELLKDDEIKPLVQHCTIGKDRTGIGSAIVLFALGADLQTVLADYLMTEITLAPYKEQLLQMVSQDFTEEELNNKKYLFAAREEYMMSAIDAIVEKYASVNHWLEKEYGLTADVKKSIREKYLEEPY